MDWYTRAVLASKFLHEILTLGKKMTEYTLLFFVSIAGITYLVFTYNRLVRLRINTQVALKNIDVALKQRHEEIKNLIGVCKRYMSYEAATQESVTSIRSNPLFNLEKLNNDASGESIFGKISEIAKIESQLSSAKAEMLLVAESYPDLKADGNFVHLQSRISSLDSVIADRQELFNDVVGSYNTVRESFPNMLFASSFGFKKIDLLVISETKIGDVNVNELFAD